MGERVGRDTLSVSYPPNSGSLLGMPLKRRSRENLYMLQNRSAYPCNWVFGLSLTYSRLAAALPTAAGQQSQEWSQIQFPPMQ